MQHFQARTGARQTGPRNSTCFQLSRYLTWLLLIAGLGRPALAGSGDTSVAAQLASRVRQASGDKTFEPPSVAERNAAERLFVRTLRGDETFAALREAWSAQHFDLQRLPVEDGALWVLSESPMHRTGRGCYAFRRQAALRVALQAPHSFADKHTRQLAAELFVDGSFSAAAWNTVHRRIVDVAHTENCLLNAFSKAFLWVHQDHAWVCQLHGFSQAKRTTLAGRTSDLIVSNGTRSGALWLTRAGRVFREMPDVAVRLFPQEVSELGATTNRQARLVRETGVGKFCHLEMSREFRTALLEGSGRRADLLKALERVFRTHHRECAEPMDSDAPDTDPISSGCHRCFGPRGRNPSDQFAESIR